LAATSCCEDCRCTHYYDLLGIDSSHLFFLLRVLLRHGAVSDAAQALSDLLDLHTCQRKRELLTSTRCLDAECFPSHGGLPALDVRVDRDLVTAAVSARDPAVPEDFPRHAIIEGRHVSFDAGERDVTHLLDAAADDAAIVMYDEDAYDVVRELTETSVVGVFPIRSVQLLGAMFDCQAITAEEVVEMCGAALDDMDERMGTLSERKRSQKTQEINALLNRVALSGAQSDTKGAAS